MSNAILQFNKATTRISKITEGIKDDEIKRAVAEFASAASLLNEILKKNEGSITQGQASFSKAMNDFAKVMERIEKGSQSITEISSSLSKAAKNLEELSGDLKKHPWKLLKKQ